MVWTALKPVPKLMLGPRPGTELETVGKVLEPLLGFVPGQGTKPETMPELEKEKETEQDNKHSVLHP